jgi:hypothetical protein
MSETMPNSEKTASKKTRYKISEEAALEQVEIFEDYYELELKKDYEVNHDALVKLIKFGRVSIEEGDDTINVIQHLKHTYDAIPGSLKWAEVTARHKIAAGRMGGKKERDKASMYEGLINMGASMTTTDRDALKQLRGVDMSCFEVLATLFTLV